MPNTSFKLTQHGAASPPPADPLNSVRWAAGRGIGTIPLRR